MIRISVAVCLLFAVTCVPRALAGDRDTKPAAEAAKAPEKAPEKAPAAAPAPTGEPKTVTTPSGLQYVDLKVGSGKEAAAGMEAKVHYTGWLTNGTKFDSSVDRSEPFEFPLGAGRVIKGWDEGVAGMKLGGKRKLTIPSKLGYGSGGAPPLIPPDATLVFEVELLDVR